jgi:hypothetical protein
MLYYYWLMRTHYRLLAAQIDNIVSKMEAACVAALEAKKAEILAA